DVTATLVAGGTTPATTGVVLAVSGCPPGTICQFNRGFIAPHNPPDDPSIATLSISPSGTMAAGSYPLTITAKGGGTTRTASVTLVVKTLDFTLPRTPATPTFPYTSRFRSDVTATLVAGGTTPATTGVVLAVSGCPPGTICQFNR